MDKFIKNRTLAIIFLAATVSVATCSCEKVGPENNDYKEFVPIVLTKAEQKVADATNDFGWNAYHQLYKDDQVLISPLSLSLAFSMTAIGADGNTAEEMRSTLGFKDCETKDMNSFYEKMVDALVDIDTKTTFEVANSIWASKSIKVKNDFINSAKKYYSSEVRSVDFSNPSTLKDINSWCAEKTHNKIKSILDQLDPNTKMALINALYFKGEWTDQFDEKTTKEKFSTITGSDTKVDMMHLTASLRYSEYDGYRMVTIPYGNGAFNMSVILPNAKKDFKAEAARLDADVWKKLVSKSSSNPVILQLPQFSFEFETGLIEALQAMGMKDAFNAAKADFSGISDTPLYISEAKQKTFIDVNTKSTEAAAVTYIGMKVTSVAPTKQPVSFTADRPFIFVIHEQSTGSLLFIGQKVK